MTLEGLVVHDQILFAPGGDVHTWVYGIASEMYFNVEREAPLNKRPNKTAGEPPVGSLLAGLRVDVGRITPKTFTIDTASTVHYTKYVIKGTNRIFARGEGGRFAAADEGGGMYLPANPGYGRGRWRQSVRGQAANNFLGRAYDATARRHPALRGTSME
jgi:hypothetical protein